jgi:translation initiation factor 2B subunit (eIF-2B alpha/beta/delta family)
MHTLVAVLIATLVFASHGLPETNPTYAALQNARRVMESQQDQSDSQIEDAARRRAAAYEVHQFEVHLAEFADAWNDFVKEYSDKGTYNLKKAKLLSKALKKLQPHLPK